VFDRGKLCAPGWHQLLDLFEFGEGAGSDGGATAKPHVQWIGAEQCVLVVVSAMVGGYAEFYAILASDRGKLEPCDMSK